MIVEVLSDSAYSAGALFSQCSFSDQLDTLLRTCVRTMCPFLCQLRETPFLHRPPRNRRHPRHRRKRRPQSKSLASFGSLPHSQLRPSHHAFAREGKLKPDHLAGSSSLWRATGKNVFAWNSINDAVRRAGGPGVDVLSWPRDSYRDNSDITARALQPRAHANCPW